MQIILGNIKSQIITDNPGLLRALRKLYSFKIPGAEFTPAYKRRGWDGKKYFISKEGVFRTGLLNRVLKNLSRAGCEPDLVGAKEDTKICWEIPDSLGGYVLRDYQEDLALEGLVKARGVIKSPTGSGKTLIMAAMLKALGNKKTVILFNAKNLIVQTYEFLKKCGIKNLGINMGGNYIYGDIMLTTIQGIEKVFSIK